MSMDRLPNELLLMIFTYIDDYKERVKLELVCRQWQKIMKDHGWKHEQLIQIRKVCWIEPIGHRCGRNLIDCYIDQVDINSKLIRLIANHLPALKHLTFRFCKLKKLNATLLEPLRVLGTRLLSLTFFETLDDYQPNHYFLRHFSHLKHVGLQLTRQQLSVDKLPDRFFANLRSLFICRFYDFSPDVEQMLMRAQRNSPRLAALYLDSTNANTPHQLLSRISELKNLRFLHIALHDDFTDFGSLFSCLINLPLLALQMIIPVQKLSKLFRPMSLHFRDLVHLGLFFTQPWDLRHFDNFETIGHLSTIAPKLRSLILKHKSGWVDNTTGIACQVLKIAQNGILEYLYAPYALFAIEQLHQLIRSCPNLQSISVRLRNDQRMTRNELFSEVAELRHLVAEQWRVGTRKHVPLELLILGRSGDCFSDPFLTIHTEHFGSAPSNSVLDELMQTEVFCDKNDDAIPSFATWYHSVH